MISSCSYFPGSIGWGTERPTGLSLPTKKFENKHRYFDTSVTETFNAKYVQCNISIWLQKNEKSL